MIFIEILAWSAAALAGLPASLLLVNLLLYRRPRRPEAPGQPRISVLIPARDEEASIRAAVESVLESRGVELEIVVMDDHSSDMTARIVDDLAARDSRVRLAMAPRLPNDWNGKQHACHALAQEARYDLFVFMDADVRLEPEALARVTAEMKARRLDLLSGFPRQETRSPSEKLVVPLIHFLLLGFLPMLGMRFSGAPAFAAGCGQFFLARREAYEVAGGHGAIRASRHDGLGLPRAFRSAGFKTDLTDLTALARCRMYHNAREVWHGFAKNADEGMATPRAIGVWTVLLLGGQVLPGLLWLGGLAVGASAALMLPAALGTGLAYATRFALTARFRQSLLGALLHPVGIVVVMAIQWYALGRGASGRRVAWKGRVAT